MKRSAALILAVASIAAAATACEDSPTEVHRHEGAVAMARPGGELTPLAAEVRTVTARFHSTTQSQKAGYEETSECVAAPGLGGMGQHWVNPALVDPMFDPLQPEVVLYEPGPNGKPKLIAVEYIVIDVGQPAPTFDGQPFDVGGTPVPAPHWSLHVWLHKDNPNGLFAPFNPTVVCPAS